MRALRGLRRWAVAAALVSPALGFAQPDAGVAAPRQLVTTATAWTGDFDGMLERRVVRFLVPYSRSLYTLDKGRERGLTAELARDFEKHLNEKYKQRLKKRPLTVLIIVTTATSSSRTSPRRAPSCAPTPAALVHFRARPPSMPVLPGA